MKAPGLQPGTQEQNPEYFPPEYIYGYTRLVPTKTGDLVPEISVQIEKRAGNTPDNVIWKLKLLRRFFEINQYEVTEELLNLDNMHLNALLHILCGVIIIPSGANSPYPNYSSAYVKLLRNGIIPLVENIKKKRALWPLTDEGRKFDKQIDDYLCIIEKETGIKSVDLFRVDNIPSFFAGSVSPSSKKRVASRSLEEVLHEISMGVQGVPISIISAKFKRHRSSIHHFFTNQGNNKMLNDDLVKFLKSIYSFN